MLKYFLSGVHEYVEFIDSFTYLPFKLKGFEPAPRSYSFAPQALENKGKRGSGIKMHAQIIVNMRFRSVIFFFIRIAQFFFTFHKIGHNPGC